MIETFSNKNRKFATYRPGLKEIVKEVLHKNKIIQVRNMDIWKERVLAKKYIKIKMNK